MLIQFVRKVYIRTKNSFLTISSVQALLIIHHSEKITSLFWEMLRIEIIVWTQSQYKRFEL